MEGIPNKTGVFMFDCVYLKNGRKAEAVQTGTVPVHKSGLIREIF